MTQAQEVATLQQENAAVKRQAATLMSLLAEAQRMRQLDIDALHSTIRIREKQRDELRAQVATLTRQLAEAQSQLDTQAEMVMDVSKRNTAAERQIAAVREYATEVIGNGALGGTMLIGAKRVLALLDAPAIDMNPTTAGTELEGLPGKPAAGPVGVTPGVPSPQLPTGGVHAEAAPTHDPLCECYTLGICEYCRAKQDAMDEDQ